MLQSGAAPAQLVHWLNVIRTMAPPLHPSLLGAGQVLPYEGIGPPPPGSAPLVLPGGEHGPLLVSAPQAVLEALVVSAGFEGLC